MSVDVHQRALQLAMRARVEGLLGRDRQWVEAHLDECPACAASVAALDHALGGLRAPIIMADARLVRATQLRVRVRAEQLERRKAAMRPVWLATALVVVVGLLSTAAAWQVFAMAGEWLRLTALSSRLVFALLWIAPAIGASLLLLACGSHRARWTAFAEIWER
jgi:anti-sigma factor RsiW